MTKKIVQKAVFRVFYLRFQFPFLPCRLQVFDHQVFGVGDFYPTPGTKISRIEQIEAGFGNAQWGIWSDPVRFSVIVTDVFDAGQVDILNRQVCFFWICR